MILILNKNLQQKIPLKIRRITFTSPSMRKVSAVGLFCRDKFEEIPKQKVIDLSKLEKIYFNSKVYCLGVL